MKANIRHKGKTRVVVIGGGLGGLRLMKALKGCGMQVVLVDKNNYHQFPPLIYQVASAGLEPSSISFPFRKILQGREDVYFRMGEVKSIDASEKVLQTSFGKLYYDYLVIAAGATTNFFGNDHIAAAALPMKTVMDGMNLRNTILSNMERAEVETDEETLQSLLTVAVVGGGPSGVEIAGALAEMKRTIAPRDYPDIDTSKIRIVLVNSDVRLLKSMDEASSVRAERDLREMGVEVMVRTRVADYRDGVLHMEDGSTLAAKTVIWVAGVRANRIASTPEMTLGAGGRIVTDTCLRVKGMNDVFAIGDVSIVDGDQDYPHGHPQLAQVAMQQADCVAKTIRLRASSKQGAGNVNDLVFHYKDLGTMATIGRRKAVAEIGRLKFGGNTAWLLWLVVHLRSLLGVRNKIVVLINWMWNYFNYRNSLRLIFRNEEK